VFLVVTGSSKKWGGVHPSSNNNFPQDYLSDLFTFYQEERFRDASFLREMYEEKGLSTTQIAKKICSSHSTVLKYLKIHGIPVRQLE